MPNEAAVLAGGGGEDVREETLAALVHGRYLVAPSSVGGAPLVVGFHGYGESAEHHLSELRRMPGSERWDLCAVAALHRFYNTRTGEVVGCWMTSQHRAQAIDDNLRYVTSVIARLRRPRQPLVIAGFSQGVAMAYRCAARCGFPCSGLIVLAGDVPPDVVDDGIESLPPVLLGRGETDPLYKVDKMDEDVAALEAAGVAVETCVFDDGHVWAPEFVEAAGRFVEQKLARRAP